MIFLLLLAIVGPFLRTDKLFNDHIQHAQRLVSEGELPPKIKG